MADVKHTPWQTSGVRVRYDGQAWLQVIGETDGKQFQVALVPYGDRTPEEHREAHAHQRLIAAAPEQLEALTKISCLDGNWNDSGIRAGTFEDGVEAGRREAASIARAAIAKATGQ